MFCNGLHILNGGVAVAPESIHAVPTPAKASSSFREIELFVLILGANVHPSERSVMAVSRSRMEGIWFWARIRARNVLWLLNYCVDVVCLDETPNHMGSSSPSWPNSQRGEPQSTWIIMISYFLMEKYTIRRTQWPWCGLKTISVCQSDDVALSHRREQRTRSSFKTRDLDATYKSWGSKRRQHYRSSSQPPHPPSRSVHYQRTIKVLTSDIVESIRRKLRSNSLQQVNTATGHCKWPLFFDVTESDWNEVSEWL